MGLQEKNLAADKLFHNFFWSMEKVNALKNSSMEGTWIRNFSSPAAHQCWCKSWGPGCKSECPVKLLLKTFVRQWFIH